MSPIEANREIYTLLKDGVKVTLSDPDSEGETVEVLQVIDWDTSENNDFFAASQFWITGEMYTKRPDIVCFVNGIPLVLMEFKRIDVHLKAALTITSETTKTPFHTSFGITVLLSNGTESKVGSNDWEHFAEWKRVHSEDEPPEVSLETILRTLHTRKIARHR